MTRQPLANRFVTAHTARAVRDADADPETAFMPLEDDRSAHGLDDPSRECGQGGLVASGAEDHEFIAADARHEHVGISFRTQDPGRMDEHGVAGCVSQRVVDLLEAVEIHMKQRQPCFAGAGRIRPLAAGKVREHRFGGTEQDPVEIAAVRQPRQ